MKKQKSREEIDIEMKEVLLNIHAWQEEKQHLKDYIICHNLIQNLCLMTGRRVDSTIDKIGDWFFSKDEQTAIKNVHSKENIKFLAQVMMPKNYKRKETVRI